MKVEERAIDALIPYAKNARKLTEAQIDGVAASIKQFGYDTPILVDSENVIIAGHARYAALKKLGHKKVKVVVSDISKRDAAARRLIDNRQVESREYDPELVRLELEEFDLDLAPFAVDFDDILALADEEGDAPSIHAAGDEKRATLSDRFLVPPFSVLDARQGYWQERKRQWLALGIKSELGRGGGHLAGVRDRRPV